MKTYLRLQQYITEFYLERERLQAGAVEEVETNTFKITRPVELNCIRLSTGTETVGSSVLFGRVQGLCVGGVVARVGCCCCCCCCAVCVR